MTNLPPALRKKSTLRDVAREAGVSIAAASYALNGGGSIGEEVRARVREVAQALDYRPNRSAREVRTGRNMTLGLVVPDLRNPYYPALAQSIEHAAREAGYTVVLLDSSGGTDDELTAMRHLEQQGVGGAIWCRTSSTEADAAPPFSMPVVVIGSPGINFDNVTTDDVAGGRLAARHLLERGHRRIGLLSGADIADGRDDRTHGFTDELDGRAELVWRSRTPYSIDLSPRIIEQLERRDVTAVMCGNDLIAVGVLRAARQLGIAVPDELSVVGFDDIPWAAIVTPELTTVRQPVGEMAAAAMTLLLDRLAEPERPVRHFRVGVSLIKRDSVAAVRNG